MGKPFEKELLKIDETYRWAISQPVEDFKMDLLYDKKFPLFIVGSGGSLSACHYAAIMYQQMGIMAKAVTPLELFYARIALPNSSILFISASGKNTDILFSYKKALSLEPRRVFSLCMKIGSPLAKLANEYSIAKHFEFNNPAGKDGFLATNSLIAFFSILFNLFTDGLEEQQETIQPHDDFFIELNSFLGKIGGDYTFNILAAGYGYPVAVDIESKLVEAALADVIVSDYRNFGHGRHHWFAKRKENSAIIAIVTPEEELIASKTLSLLPKDIPLLILKTSEHGAFASIRLLVQAFHFINEIGKIQKIDPGRPGVPEYGSKLYNLRYSNLLKESTGGSELERIAILRKVRVATFDALTVKELDFWKTSYAEFKRKLSATKFGAIIFDYDGTLCSSENRFNGVDQEIIEKIISLLNKGIIIGIATGRGQSVRNDFISKIPIKMHSRVVIGYYNCSDVKLLSDNKLPTRKGGQNNTLAEIYDQLTTYTFPDIIRPELKPNQITIEIEEKKGWHKVRTIIIDLLLSKNYTGIQILESTHSIDVIDQASTSKLNILSVCSKLARKEGLTDSCLCIGDKGQWPGNDYLLLSSEFSLSVDEVSSLGETCWNLAPPGIKNIKATDYYLSFTKFEKTGIIITLP